MADKKISALTGATTPLVGTEVLPIVQSGSTVKVNVADLTAGRAVASAGGTFSDNFIQGVAAKGVNFTANTSAAGMSSQLLNWYETGTWTPSLGGNTTYSAQSGSYTRIGRQVTVHFVVGVTTLGTGNGSEIGGIPFTVTSTNRGAGGVAFVSSPATAFASINPYATANDVYIKFVCSSTTGTWTDGATVFTNGTTISGTVTYFV